MSEKQAKPMAWPELCKYSFAPKRRSASHLDCHLIHNVLRDSHLEDVVRLASYRQSVPSEPEVVGSNPAGRTTYDGAFLNRRQNPLVEGQTLLVMLMRNLREVAFDVGWGFWSCDIYLARGAGRFHDGRHVLSCLVSVYQ